MKSQYSIIFLGIFNGVCCYPSPSESDQYGNLFCPSESISPCDSIQDNHFPEVEYPTKLLDTIEPYFYRAADQHDILAPFSSDVKNAYNFLDVGRKVKETQFKSQTSSEEIVKMEAPENANFESNVEVSKDINSELNILDQHEETNIEPDVDVLEEPEESDMEQNVEVLAESEEANIQPNVEILGQPEDANNEPNIERIEEVTSEPKITNSDSSVEGLELIKAVEEFNIEPTNIPTVSAEASETSQGHSSESKHSNDS